MTPTVKRIAIGVGVLACCALSIARVAVPPRAVPATAPDTVFSAERAMRHVEQIAQRPHAMGTADHDRVRDYIVGQLSALKLVAQIQNTTAIGTRYQQAGRVQNILARMPGSVPNGKALLLMVHYDGVEAGPAAADDGAGVAALLETLRAIRAGKPLAHDVIALFTDGEESGLLGAAAFVREHPWAKDVGVVLNFEARGTTGRSFMFETGPGNLDAARALRSAGDATAGSVYATIYRLLPNDTDLSELAVLGLPALNFAFADGVQRYHTSHDDVAHLNPGSLQHHGSQMLAMARTFGNEALPRARTGDAVFFDLPIVGLIVYPQGLELPLAAVALALVLGVIVRDRKGAGAGVMATIVAVGLSSIVGWAIGKTLSGPPVWSGWYATGMAMLAISIAVACIAAVKRRVSPAGIHAGALIIWSVIALTVSISAPGVGYLFTWPLLFAAGAALLSRCRQIGEWAAAVVTLLILVGFIYGVAVVMLGLTGAGAIALCAVAALVTLLLTPQIELLAGNARWSGAPWLTGAGVIALVVGISTVHPSAEHPLRSALVYAENADSSDAWLGGYGGADIPWTREAIGSATPGPEWTNRLLESGGRFTRRQIDRVPLDAPSAKLVRDTTSGATRKILLHISARGTTGLVMHARGTKVLSAAIDGRLVDTTRYRRHAPEWIMQYWAMPDSGADVALTVPAGGHIEFDLAARRAGLPSTVGAKIPARPASVVPSQAGDVSVVYRQWRY